MKPSFTAVIAHIAMLSSACAVDSDETRRSTLDRAPSDEMAGDDGAAGSADVVTSSLDSASSLGQKGLALESSRWPAGVPVKVCLTDDSTTSELMRSELMRHVEETWTGYSNLTFTWKEATGAFRICNAGNHTQSDIKIWQTTAVNGGASCVGSRCRLSAFVGPEPNTCHGLTHPFAGTCVTANYIDGMAHTFLHELGHAAGLKHEEQRTDSPCPERAADGNLAESSEVLYLGEDSDELSTMNRCSGEIGKISLGDISSIQTLYGAAPTHVKWEVSSWETTNLWAQVNDPQVNVTDFFPNLGRTKVTQLSAITLTSGADYTAYATWSNTRMSCRVTRPNASLVRDTPQHALPNDFAAEPVRVVCYHLPSLVAVVNNI
jgi:hypothetical protein